MRLSFLLLAFHLLSNLHGDHVEALLIPYRMIELSFAKEGIISNLHHKEGNFVIKGELIAEQVLTQEELQRQHADKILIQKKNEAQSHAELLKKGMVPKDIANEKQLAFELAELEYFRTLANVAERRIKAPFNGVIVKREHHPQEWVRSGEVIYQLLDNEKIYAELLLEPSQIKGLEVGKSIKLNLAKVSTGTVEFISPLIDATSNLIRVKILINNKVAKLKPGASINIDLNI